MTSLLTSGGMPVGSSARVRLSNAEASLVRSAQKTLLGNWLGYATKPAPHLYPYQWSWDSGFIAMGYARYDQERAMEELRSLFDGQWKNGLLPHIVFHEWNGKDKVYFPGPDYWQIERSPQAPRHVLTSGIVQPPIHAIAAFQIYQHAQDQKLALDFLIELFPQLVAWHHYLYRERNFNQDGLIYIRHPWESGQNNSPLWDTIMQSMLVSPDMIPPYTRVDNQAIHPFQRPSDDDYDRYVYLLAHARERKYDESLIQKDCPFLVQDVLFNTLLVKANRDLAAIASLIGFDPNPFERWACQTAQSINDKLWNPEAGFYMPYDLTTEVAIPVCVASSFVPLFAHIPTIKQASTMVAHLQSSAFQRDSLAKWIVPSCSRDEKGFCEYLAWRGPIWMTLNWLLFHGLKKYGFLTEAEQLRFSTLRLLNQSGFHECFNPDSGQGLGTANFSGSAAVLLELLLSDC